MGVALVATLTVTAATGGRAAGSTPFGLGAYESLSGTYSCATEMLTGIVDLSTTTFDFASLAVRDGSGTGVTFAHGGALPAGRQVAVSTPARDIEIELTHRSGQTELLLGQTFGSLECFANTDAEPGRFVAVDARRLYDSRNPADHAGGARLPAGASTAVELGLPTNDRITAVVVNVTAADPAAPGFVSLSGFPEPGSPDTSALNISRAGQFVANQAIVPTGRGFARPIDDHISVYTSTETHLVVDLLGYFEGTDRQPVAAGRFEPVTPFRALDTRPASLIGHQGGKPASGSLTRATIDVPGAPPAQVGAAVVNVTVVEPDGPGFVQAGASGQVVPGETSTVNFGRAGQVVANIAIVPVSPQGELEIYTLTSAHLIVDVVGWFTNGSATSGTSGMFQPIPPERFLDTRTLSAVSYSATTEGGVDLDKPGPSRPDVHLTLPPFEPGSTLAINLTATQADGPGFLQASAAATLTRGATSNVNVVSAGDTVANGAFVTTDADRSIGIYSSGGAHVVGDVVGYFTP